MRTNGDVGEGMGVQVIRLLCCFLRVRCLLLCLSITLLPLRCECSSVCWEGILYGSPKQFLAGDRLSLLKDADTEEARG